MDLTPLDLAILRACALGLSREDIAAHLGLPVPVVRSRLTAIIRELGAQSTLEAILLALRRGLITVPGSLEEVGAEPPAGAPPATDPNGPDLP